MIYILLLLGLENNDLQNSTSQFGVFLTKNKNDHNFIG